MLDARTGLYQGGCRAHDSDVLKITALSDDRFVTSSADYTNAVWHFKKTDAGPVLLSRLKGADLRPVSGPCLSFSFLLLGEVACSRFQRPSSAFKRTSPHPRGNGRTGHSDPVPCVATYKRDLYTVSTGNKLACFPNFEEESGIQTCRSVKSAACHGGACSKR